MSPTDKILKYESKFTQFDTLMQFKVKHILLVSSSYDSYVLEEDGQLTDLIYNEYLELNLTVTPHVRRASTSDEAMDILKNNEIDMVIIFKRVSDINVIEFGKEMKSIYPQLPLIFLAYHERELKDMDNDDYNAVIDMKFIWTGDVKILLSIIKQIEDRKNIDHDTSQIGVRVIILVEDSVKFYSTFLPSLYSEIMIQTRSLMVESLNISNKILRMRARPKILLAQNYEQALEYYNEYKKYLLAVICDFRFKINGVIDDEAGIKLIKEMRADYQDLPVLMQSSDEKNSRMANENNVGFLSKRSPKLLNDLRNFILTHFGFGDFVFIDIETGAELARAHDFRSIEKCLAKIPEKSLLYHAYRNHFSNWLLARTEFDLADQLRPRKVSEFKDGEELRKYLISTFRNFRHEKQRGQITNFSRTRFDSQSEFVRIGGGSLGGKGRGLAYINALINQYQLDKRFDNVNIAVPTSVILGTDVFDAFIERNNLLEFALSDVPDDKINKRFQRSRLPKFIHNDLDTLLEHFDYPIAVRSSSMLEDSHLQPYAGVYETEMLPNNHPDPKVRRFQLETAIKTIYASTFYHKTKVYHENAGNRMEEEKMAVIIQKAVGNRYNGAFYPNLSGVALSYNYYSLENIKPEDGVVYIALGFGKQIVEGANCLRFSPSHPNKLPQFSTVKDMLANSQNEFFAINLKDAPEVFSPDFGDGLTKYGLDKAEKDGTLYHVCSTYSAENNSVYVGSSRKGVRIVTFAPILKTKTFPLAQIVKQMLRIGSEGLNCPVEIEFAVNLDVPKGEPKQFYFLQVRPMIKESQIDIVNLDTVPKDSIIGKSNRTLGNNIFDDIKDIVIVTPDKFDRAKTVKIADEVGYFNQKLSAENLPYLLIGPGRWGTTERWLGIPVTWEKISGATVIVEAAYGDFAPDPSFGTHFFQNLTSFEIGYLTVNQNTNNGFIDTGWILTQNICEQTDYISHIRLDNPIKILIDGRLKNAVITKY